MMKMLEVTSMINSLAIKQEEMITMTASMITITQLLGPEEKKNRSMKCGQAHLRSLRSQSLNSLTSIYSKTVWGLRAGVALNSSSKTTTLINYSRGPTVVLTAAIRRPQLPINGKL